MSFDDPQFPSAMIESCDGAEGEQASTGLNVADSLRFSQFSRHSGVPIPHVEDEQAILAKDLREDVKNPLSGFLITKIVEYVSAQDGIETFGIGAESQDIPDLPIERETCRRLSASHCNELA